MGKLDGKVAVVIGAARGQDRSHAVTLGRLGIVVANAGIASLGPGLPVGAFLDSVNVNFVGVVNLVTAAYST